MHKAQTCLLGDRLKCREHFKLPAIAWTLHIKARLQNGIMLSPLTFDALGSGTSRCRGVGPILAGQPTPVKGTPCSEPHPIVLDGRQCFPFDGTLEKRIGRSLIDKPG